MGGADWEFFCLQAVKKAARQTNPKNRPKGVLNKIRILYRNL